LDWKSEIEKLNFDDDKSTPKQMISEFLEANDDLDEINAAIIIYTTKNEGFAVSYAGMNTFEVIGMLQMASLEIMDDAFSPGDAKDE
jgi:hypothetical protein